MKTYTQDQIQEVANALKNHKIIAFPTDTVYGVSVLYGDVNDLHALKNAKNRPETKPIPMMVSSLSQMEKIAYVSKDVKKIVESLLPGALTLVLPVKNVPSEYTNGLPTIAIRIPDEKFILDLIEYLDCPLLVSSANQSGCPTALTYHDVFEQLPNIDGVVLGTCQALQASTIVDCTQDEIQILREGPITKTQVLEVLK